MSPRWTMSWREPTRCELRGARMLAVLGLWATIALPASAREYDAGSVRIFDPWTRATATAGADAVGFLTITNEGAKPERLIGAACPVAAVTTIRSRTDSLGGVDIAPGETVKLTPGGLHLVLGGTKQRLARGDTIACRLQFRGAGAIDVQLLVRSAHATEPLMGPMD